MPNLLDPEAIQRAELLGIQARQIVEGYMAGEHRSPFRGFAIEFAQHREYAHGDDTRHLDWKVLGRTDRYYIKQYEQETNFVAHLLLDASESMRYGSGKVTKFDYAKTMAACLAYLILLQRDSVALGFFNSKVQEYLPRTDNMAKIHPIMAALSVFPPSGQTNIPTVLHDMARQIRRKGIVVLISDLFDDEDKILDGIQHLRFGGNEVIVFHVLDRYELEFPFKGNIEFFGLEKEPKVTTQPRDIRKSYLERVEAFQKKVREGCERNQAHYVLVNTSQPWHEVLSSYLAFRKRTG